MRKIWGFIKDSAVLIAAVAAFISALSAYLAYDFSKKVLEPTERPIISLEQQKMRTEPFVNMPAVVIHLSYEFRNIGKHPAKNIILRGSWSPEGNLEKFSSNMYDEQTMVNQIDPNGTFTWPQKFLQQGTKGKDGEVILDELKLYIYLLVTYEDAFSAEKKLFCNEHWLTYNTGQDKVNHAMIKDKLLLEKYVDKVFSQIRDECKLKD